MTYKIAGSAEDYKLLEQMNKTTITRYVEMKHIAHNISKSMKDLNDKCMLLAHGHLNLNFECIIIP